MTCTTQSTSLPPARCYSSCPFQCRCTINPHSHHICSIGSCTCYNKTRHICGCPPSICKTFSSTSTDFQSRPSVYRTGCPLLLKNTAMASLPSDGKVLDAANLEAFKLRLLSLQAHMAQISDGKRLKESLLKQPNSQIDSVAITHLPDADNSNDNGDDDMHMLCFDDSDDTQEYRRNVYRWKEYNCDMHLKRIIEASRTCAAFVMLEDLHQRLTCHMHQYINSVAKGLMGDEKTHYLGVFKKDGPFKLKPLDEGTYFDLLDFISKRNRPSRDLLKALTAAEDGLIQEAYSSGYDAIEIGDIRSQMVRYFQFLKKNGRPIDYYCIPFTDKELMYQQIQDLKQSVCDGKLGLLQDVAKLVKVGCFFSFQKLTKEGYKRKSYLN